MLHEFITINRTELINRCRHKGAKKYETPANASTAEYGVPLFLDQLVAMLRTEQSSGIGGVLDAGDSRPQSEIGRSAALRGAELLRSGYTVDEVVHEYGNICQAVTAMAIEVRTPISTEEFRTLNRCLDDAIADAVSSYALVGKAVVAEQAQGLHARLDLFLEEHRRVAEVAIHAFLAIKSGNVGVTGATGALLAHALGDLSNLVERAVQDVRSAAAPTSD
jgi:hypothetical protein